MHQLIENASYQLDYAAAFSCTMEADEQLRLVTNQIAQYPFQFLADFNGFRFAPFGRDGGGITFCIASTHTVELLHFSQTASFPQL
ncbi:MAG: hypothetical protein ACFCU3_02025 [Verrucomicrobiales bacterium]